MKYVSTRGAAGVTAAEALVYGLAADGGLYVPECMPQQVPDWATMCDLTYPELAAEVLRLFFPEWSQERCLEICRRAYTGTFCAQGIVRVREVGARRYFTELYYGRTLAFKDLALSVFPHLLQAAKEDLGMTGTTLILTATSGDTGKAALEGFRDVPGTEILVFYPEHGVSSMQRAQMRTQPGDNVHVCGIEGNFDDAQSFLKDVFESPELRAYAAAQGVHFSSANSINIGRLLPQIVYYIRTYTELLKHGDLAPGETFHAAVPTGNFGNILAGYFAKRLGVPIGRLVCASNANHVLADFFATGTYDRRREFAATLSPSMDILISSNFERFLYYVLGEDAAKTAEYMRRLKEDSVFTLCEEERAGITDFLGGWQDDAATLTTMREMYGRYGYLPDPHTAVAIGVVRELQEAAKLPEGPVVIMATANPYKFPDALAEALELPRKDNPYEMMWEVANTTNLPIPTSFLQMEHEPVRFDEVVAKEDMERVVRRCIDGVKEKRNG